MTNLTKTGLKVDLLPFVNVADPGGAFPLFANTQEEWAWRKDVFAPHELDAIIRIAESQEMVQGLTGGGAIGTKQSVDTRNSDVKFLFPNSLTSWIFQRLTMVVTEMNDRYFNFDLASFDQGLQLTRYDGEQEQHYDWHVDRGMGTGQRKLSLTLQLSDPNDYEGGDLELRFGKDPVKINKDRGMIALFPSYTMHRVKPVTKGIRYSLVAWVSGPAFK
jgi:PKHD-type hydroxylase|tara:strand:+ start:3559 stop:4212 length:654 start_codon:yes stop_codon:yes gene_type:complete